MRCLLEDLLKRIAIFVGIWFRSLASGGSPPIPQEALQPQVEISNGFAVASEHVSQLVPSSSEHPLTEESSSPLEESTAEVVEVSTHGKVRIAIISETSVPPALETWLRYHIRWAGIDKFFLCFESEPRWASEVLSSTEFIDRVEMVKPADIEHEGGSGSFTGLQSRQEFCVTEGLSRARQQRFDWVLHIDDDELIYSPEGQQLSDVFSKVSASYGSIHFQNVEAVVPKEKDPLNCFLEVNAFRADLGSFVAYGNGKSAARATLTYGASYYGPHHFATNAGELNTALNWSASKSSSWPWPIVLHFESCPFTRWLRKFWLAHATPAALVKQIPFPFYRESTFRVAACAKDFDSCDVRGLHDFYTSMKSPQPSEHLHLLQVHLPWKEILHGEANLKAALREDRLLLEIVASKVATSLPEISFWRPPDPEHELISFLAHFRSHIEL